MENFIEVCLEELDIHSSGNNALAHNYKKSEVASNRILIGCYEVPGYGGANTATYKLFEIMQRDGLDVHYVNIISEEDIEYFSKIFGEGFGNPRCLTNVHNCRIKGSLYEYQPELVNLIDRLSPDKLVARGHIPAILFKHASPVGKLIFFTSGCGQAKSYVAQKVAEDYETLFKHIEFSKRRLPILFSHEKDAVEFSDLVITNSDMVMFLYRNFFPMQLKKIHPNVIWDAEWIYKDALAYSDLKRPFFKRDIDVIFAASSWNRPEKNYGLVKKIVTQSKNMKIFVVGEFGKKLANVKNTGLITKQEDMFSLLGRTKTVVSPSLYDSAPGILFEASAMGCNIITSRNSGNWMICNKKLLIDTFSVDEFLKKISLSLTKKFKDNIKHFIRTDSYRNLINAILANEHNTSTYEDGITAIVLTLGEETTQGAINSLKKQTLLPKKIIVVRNVTPFYKALNFGAHQVKTEFFIQVDSDMILDENCLEDLRNCMHENVGIVVGHLRDCLIGRATGIKMFRTKCFEKFQFQNSISPDTDFRDEIIKDGWKTVYAIKFQGQSNAQWHTFGEHAPLYTPQYIYRKYLLEGGRYRYRKNIDGFKWHLQKLQDSTHSGSLIAQIAMSHGIFLEKEDLLKPNLNHEDFNFLQRYFKSAKVCIIRKKVTRSFYPITLRAIFKKFYKLGIRLRQEEFQIFKYYLDILNERDDYLALIAKIGLFHGLFLEKFNRNRFKKDYDSLKELLSKYTYWFILRKSLKKFLSKYFIYFPAIRYVKKLKEHL